MPVSIRIEPDGMAVATCSGPLGAADARQAVSSLWGDPTWSGRVAVWDMREARFDIAPEDARAIAQFVLENQPAPPPSAVAFVTARDVDFGMARMFGVYRDDPATSFRVFRDFDEAIEWALTQ